MPTALVTGPPVPVDTAPPTAGGRLGNVWLLCERLHVDLQRVVSSGCRG